MSGAVIIAERGSIMKSHFFVRLVFPAVVLAVSLPSIADDKQQAADLLDKYAASQAPFTSIKVQFESAMVHDTRMDPPYNVHNGITRTYTAGTVLSDGMRFSFRVLRWGEMRKKGESVPKDKAWYNSWLFDGTREVFFSDKLGSRGGKAPNGTGSVNTDVTPNVPLPPEKALLPSTDDAAMLGYLFGDNQRIDSVLRGASEIHVTRKNDPNGRPGCFVLQALTTGGTYKVLLDPDHGYNIAYAQVHRQPGDHLIGNPVPIPDGIVVDNSMTITRWEKRGGIWIPMDSAWTGYRKEKGQHHNTDGTTKRTEFVLSPDFKALGAFRTDDVRDGALFIVDGKTYDANGVLLMWKQGKVVPSGAKPNKNAPANLRLAQ